MATKADKKRAQQLVEKAGQEYLNVKTEQELRQWAETHLPLLDEAISLDPDNDRAWSWRGAAKSTLEDHQGAIADCTKAIELNPDNDEAWNNRGSAKNQLGDHHGAIADCNKTIELNPNHFASWISRGMAKHGLGDHQGAIKDCDEAIKLNPKNAALWSNRGSVKHASGDYQGAIADCDRAISLNPNNASPWNNRGSAKYHLEKFDDAISDFREAIRLNPKNEAARRNLEAAEIALASHESAKKPQEIKEEHHKRLKDRAESHKQNYDALIKEREALFNWITSIIIAFIVVFVIFFLFYVFDGRGSALRHAIDDLNFLTLWPYFILLFISLSPLVWKLRLNIQDAKRELVLKEDFDGRLIVEVYLDRFFSAEKDRRQFAEKYISYWMHNNPSETLLRLDKKSPDQSDAAQIDIMRELIRSQNTPS